MEPILIMEFKKSSSKSFKKVLAISKTLPGFKETDNTYCVQIDTLYDYLANQDFIKDIIESINNWKDSSILLYGKPYKTAMDYHNFIERLKSEAGKYSIILDNPDKVSLGAVTIEPLPLPIVYYPNHYGAFFAFAEDIGEQVYFCECERRAISNYLKLKRMPGGKETRTIPEKRHKPFPSIVRGSLEQYSDDANKFFSFRENICFRCNKTVPRKIYCHPMYGGVFRQHYGWYINQEYYKLGIDKSLFERMNVIPEDCTPELYDLVQRINKIIDARSNYSDNYEEVSSLRDELDRAIENSVREQMGVRKIGDAWVSETMIFNILQGLYPNEDIIRHHRPEWLEGLELDVYIPKFSLGFEYQGIQHFQAVEHWGGKKQLEKQQEHDARKKRLCQERNVLLICVNYDEPLTAEYISKRIMESTRG